MNESQNSIVPTVTPINSEPNAAPNDSPGVIVFPPALWLATLILGLVVHYFLWPFHIFHSVPAWLTRTVGVLTIVSGGSLAMWGRNTMVRGGTNVIPSRPALAIITGGPFSFTRNPLYVGNLLVYIGLTLIFNSVALLALFVPMFLLLHWGIVRREERYLERKFGEPYLVYKAMVRRWI